MNTANTTEFVFDGEDYFVAHTDAGGVRFGFKPLHAIDVPADHPMYSEVLALTPETAEAFHDKMLAAGRLSF